MSLYDLIQREGALQRYDFWLELRGVRGRQRRELRRELRTNLNHAAAEVGMGRALLNVGSMKTLAYGVTEDSYVQRPLWTRGLLAGVVTFGLVLIAVLYTATTFTAGVEASGVLGKTVHGEVFPWFGVDFTARLEESPRRSLATGVSGIGWYILGLPALVFGLVSRPWRLFAGR